VAQGLLGKKLPIRRSAMTLDRRSILTAGVGLGAAATAVKAGEFKPARDVSALGIAGLEPNSERDQTAVLQTAIDAAAAKDAALVLPAGVIRVTDLRLRAGTRLIGAARSTVIQYAGGAAFVSGEKADGLVLQDIAFDGAFMAHDLGRGEALINIANSKDIVIDGVEIRNGAAGGLGLSTSSGRIGNCTIKDVLDFGLKCLDAAGLDIRGNTVMGCGNNGILVWRSENGEDGSTITNNRISKIRNAAGGTGEYGNGINVFRAGSVLVSGNRISDCAYTAVRGNAASNIQIIANSCERLGEVAIYSEFGFEGALIANNMIDIAATGISVTNFNEGGRLAVIQGNLIRNLFRREHEKEDKRGEGIGVEADASVTGNTIEGAPTVGIQIGWGPFMRDVAATGNVIRGAKVGISITSAPDAGSCLVANNLISKTEDGAIRKMTLGVTSGPDLAREPLAGGRMMITGNVAV
jgi:uncharacterized secreted repeat protein (TIGR03808 family)